MKRAAAVLLATFILAQPGAACGPYPFVARFFFVHRPSPEIESYLAGRLGILPRGLPTAYLVIAYRHLTGSGLSADDPWLAYFRPKPTQSPGGLESWRAARGRLLPDEPRRISPYRLVEERSGGSVFQRMRQNCFADAFETAARTLENRVATFGLALAHRRAVAARAGSRLRQLR